MDLLDKISSSSAVDVGARFEKGRQIGEQRLTKELSGQILAETLGSKVGLQAFKDLQRVNPEVALKLKGAIQSESDGDTQYFVGVTKVLTKIIDSGGSVQEAAGWLGKQVALAYQDGRSGIAQKMASAVQALNNPETSDATVRNLRATNEAFESGDKGYSARTENLPGGLILQADNKGGIRVTTGSGQVLTGQAAQKAIDDARNLGITDKVDQVRMESNARTRASRVSEIKQEYSLRAREAAREQLTLTDGLKLVANAEQGIQGGIKVQLARLFPDIDVTNEALLDQTMTELALAQLSKFKGPTTDFEFGVTKSIAGDATDSKSANLAKMNSLSRANWFNQREFKQFNKFVAADGDPDEFAFNFVEKIKTKNGDFTLRQLRDTAVANNMTMEQVLSKVNK